MKIVVVVGTYRKSGTGMQYLSAIEKTIRNSFDAEFEYLFLGDCNLQTCRGCWTCYERGEENCPLKDGFLNAIRILNSADATIFYSPTYTLSISGLLKTFFDRGSYVLHRPYFKGRYALLLSSTLLVGEKKALHTMDTIVSGMGFTIAGRLGIAGEKYAKQARYKSRWDQRLQKSALRFAALAAEAKPIRPSIFDLLVFNMQKRIYSRPNGGSRSDRQFWQSKGWTHPQTRFYCKAKIPAYKRLAAGLIETIALKTGLVQL